MKDSRLDIRMPEEIKDQLLKLAEIKNIKLTDFIINEILKSISSNFVKCPNCQTAVFDKRLPFKGDITVFCSICQKPFIYKFKF